MLVYPFGMVMQNLLRAAASSYRTLLFILLLLFIMLIILLTLRLENKCYHFLLHCKVVMMLLLTLTRFLMRFILHYFDSVLKFGKIRDNLYNIISLRSLQFKHCSIMQHRRHKSLYIILSSYGVLWTYNLSAQSYSQNLSCRRQLLLISYIVFL